MNLISYTVYSVSVTPHCYIELVTFSAVCIVEQSIYMYSTRNVNLYISILSYPACILSYRAFILSYRACILSYRLSCKGKRCVHCISFIWSFFFLRKMIIKNKILFLTSMIGKIIL